MSITFTYDSTVVTIGDKEVGEEYSRAVVAQQVAYETDAGTSVVYGVGDDRKEFDVNLKNLTTTEKNDLYSFWLSTVNKQALSFVFKDSLDRYYKVRFSSNMFDAIMHNGGSLWDITLSLRTVSLQENVLVDMPLKTGLDLVTGSGTASFTRSSTATYYDSETDLLKTAIANTPRFENGTLLVEGSSENLLTYSNDMSAWGGNATITSNSIIAPDGTLTADDVEDSNVSDHEYIFKQAPTFDVAEIYTAKVFIKKDAVKRETRFPAFNLRFTGSTIESAFVFIDTYTGEYSTSKTDPETRFIIKSFSKNYWVISISAKSQDVLNTGVFVHFYPAYGASESWVNSASAVGSVGVGGVQLEKRPFASSFIPTEAATVTRAAEKPSIPFAGNHPSIMPGHAFSYAVTAISANASTDNVRTILSLVEGGADAYSDFYIISNTTDLIYKRGVQPVDFIGEEIGTESRYVITVGEDETVSVYIDGELSNTPSVEHLMTPQNKDPLNVYIGCMVIGNEFFGHITGLKIYDIALLNTQVKDA